MTDYPDPRKEKDRSGHTVIQQRTVFYKGKTIFEQGSSGNRAYYIESGLVEVSVNDEGHKLVLSKLGAGEIFGEMAVLGHEPRSATVVALEDTTVTMISQLTFDQKLASLDDPAIITLINVLTKRLKEANKSQARHFKNLMEYQKRILGIAERVDFGINESRREEFKEEVDPILEKLEKLLEKYTKD